MRFQFLLPVSAAAMVCGCATSGSEQRGREVTGAAIGAAVGGAAGLAAKAPIQGAVIGGLAGAAIGGLVKGPIIKGRQYYRDTRGYCYYVDPNGRPQYDGTVRC